MSNRVIREWVLFRGADNSQTIHNLIHFFGSVELVEDLFEIEFSCGDGLYMSDFYKWSKTGEGLHCTVTDSQLDKYDGHVDYNYPVRTVIDRKMLPFQKYLKFTMCGSKKAEQKADECWDYTLFTYKVISR